MVHSAGELLVQLCSLTLSTVMFSSYAVVACDLEDLQMRAVHSEPLEALSGFRFRVQGLGFRVPNPKPANRLKPPNRKL